MVVVGIIATITWEVGVGEDDWNDVIIIMMRMSSFELYLLLIDVPFNLSLFVRPSVQDCVEDDYDKDDVVDYEGVGGGKL